MSHQPDSEAGVGELKGLMEQSHKQFRDCVEDLKHNPPSSVSKFMKRLEFISKRSKFPSLINMVYRYKQDMILTFTLKQSGEQEMAKKNEQENLRINVITWFKGADAAVTYAQTREKYQEGTGSWFLEAGSFQNFKSESGQRLWIHGIPGCGKTILSGSIIESMQCTLSKEEYMKCGLAYFFFSYADTAKQTIEGMLSTLAAQLCEKVPILPPDIVHLYRENITQLTRHILLKALIILAKAFNRIYFVIDALDEVSISDRDILVSTLRTISTNTSLANINFIVTSRREPYLESLNEYVSESVCLTTSIVDSDIRFFLATKLEQELKFAKWNADLKITVTEALITGAQGMFRWVDCQIHELKKCLRPINIRKALSRLPPSLEETYKRILLQISEESRVLLARLLIWVTFSPKPIRIEALAEAIIFELDSHENEIDPDSRFPDPEDILELGGASLLVANEARKVTLTHYSVKEYLLSERFQSDPELASWKNLMQDPYIYLSRVCIGYLSTSSIVASPDSLQEPNTLDGVYHLRRTAQIEWPCYVKQCEVPIRQTLETTLSEALYPSDIRKTGKGAKFFRRTTQATKCLRKITGRYRC
ncbi:hypothetical protein M422DRAFT_260384 [Sphaerobolus stellatus SS14]|uniref:NACHT domain-containing protein n=1 Tax=Sphaerobolus stellatus (strain SS14) TaxID=990650 RepID=A0A0C9VI68_SPHS4|nr:hypothetical protein M422DRAFT_260384 [Sphaerobolus stellatus SS14]